MSSLDDNRTDPAPSPARLAQLLGLHPVVAVMVIAADCMLTALDVTVVLWPVSCLIAAALVWP